VSTEENPLKKTEPTSFKERRPRRTQRERRESTRDALIEATIAQFADRGFANVTVQDIARAAGVTTGAMQHHFGSKDDLLLAAADRIFFQIASPDSVDRELPTLEARCRYAVETSWSIFGQPRYFVAWEIILGGRNDPVFWSRYRDYQKTSVKKGMAFFRALFSDHVEDEETLYTLLHFCWDSLRGAALLRVFDEPEDTMKRHRELLVRALHDVVTRSASVQRR
jgi:AcrR family transcriptional regulator